MLSEKTTSVEQVSGVPIDVYDLHDAPQPMKPGFYYCIPCDEDERVHPAEVVLAGPYQSHQEALDAGLEFVRMAMEEGE